ncbi:DNA-dependent metalloprotease WSS1-like [Tasmannia lanceolata]|uniref:DNA-dependent metalloprotease WSS1-like n=1 Tax=Tasmannia lanceolata TaxID=3420 RepID=UPI004063A955
MDLGDLNKVWEIKTLKKPGEDEARKMLEKIAKQVQPIMRRHKWRAKLLSEFCPANPSLLGLNVGGGVEVKLRLRKPNRDYDFFPYEQVLDTMLHELCHNEHGPHNANFYKLWDEIRKELEELMAKGITGTGQGFDAPGRRLGGFSRHPPPSSLRQAAVSAAEKRARAGALLPSGPRRLGGDGNIMSALSPIQAAAMAAERRLQDDLWCGSGSCGESSAVYKGSTGSSKDSSVIQIDTSDALPQHKGSISGDSTFKDRSKRTSSSGTLLDHSASENTEDRAIWECGVCTLFNEPLAPICEACGIQKPKDVATKSKIWSCRFCTLENSIKLEKCSACEQWRYSYGAPVATRGPNVGT